MASRRTGPNPKPLYLQIADELRRAHKPGEQLPSMPTLAKTWGVARETVRSAIEVLQSEGLVVTWKGRGSFYRDLNTTETTIDDATMLLRLDGLVARLDDMEHRLRKLERSRDN